MKKGLLLFAAITIFLATSFAQMPEEFSYQAVLRNADGSVIANQDITVVVEIIKGDIAGSSVFTETHNVSTTAQGVVSIVVGSIQDLSGVAWGSDNFFIKLSVNGVEIGTSQLLGVPYALHAKTADEIVGGVTETDPVFTAWDKSSGISINESQVTDLQNYLTNETDPVYISSIASGITATDTAKWNNTSNSLTETDPVFTAWDKTTGIEITENQISDLGNYIETETDPSVTANFDFTGAANGDLLQFNGTRWVKVTPNYISGYTVTESDVTAHQAALSVTESQISDLGNYLETETDPSVTATFDFTGAANGDLLQYNGTKWVKVTPDYISDYTVTESDVIAHEAAIEITESQISDLQDYLTSESDPAVSDNFDFTGATNGDLLQFNGTKWVKVTPNYISDYTVTESDVTVHEAAIEITESQISDLQDYLTSESDPAVSDNFDFTGAANGDLLQFNGTKWVKVTPNYISDYTVTESDVTTHEAAIEITESQISDLQDYLTSETDPAVSDNFDFTGAANGDLLQFNGTKWVKVTPNYISDYTVTESDVTAHEAAIEITESQISDLGNYIETETDPRVPNGTQAGQMQYWNGTAWITLDAGNEGQVLTFVSGVPTWKTQLEDGEVENPTTGKIWMDRNLGASRVATSSTDADAYGDLYQWGRAADGHEDRGSSTTSTNATTAVPNGGNAWDGLFITEGSSPYDWLTPQDDNLWQGVSGTNNPCPSGYRLPTEAEWEAERQSWSSNNATGAFASPLKLPVAGYRNTSVGSLYNVGSNGYYWSSTVDGTYSRYLGFHSSAAGTNNYIRASGLSVRCIKD